MKAAAFNYFQPATLDQAMEMLAHEGESAKVLAGGQTLVPIMAFRMAQPSALIDLNRIKCLSFIREEGDKLCIGAMTRHREVERSELVASYCPLLAQAIRHVAHPVIRNRGTAGGSLCYADPAAEWPTVAMALEAELLLRSVRGERTVKASDFFLSLLTTAIMPDEILVEIRLPKAKAGDVAIFLEVSRRHGDFALVSIAAQFSFDEFGLLNEVQMALGGVDVHPIAPHEALTSLLGKKFEEICFEDVARRIARNLDPTDDIHVSAEYRHELAEGLLVRSLRLAAEKLRDR